MPGARGAADLVLARYFLSPWSKGPGRLRQQAVNICHCWRPVDDQQQVRVNQGCLANHVRETCKAALLHWELLDLVSTEFEDVL
jgi:hypothetical protein